MAGLRHRGVFPKSESFQPPKSPGESASTGQPSKTSALKLPSAVTSLGALARALMLAEPRPQLGPPRAVPVERSRPGPDRSGTAVSRTSCGALSALSLFSHSFQHPPLSVTTGQSASSHHLGSVSVRVGSSLGGVLGIHASPVDGTRSGRTACPQLLPRCHRPPGPAPFRS